MRSVTVICVLLAIGAPAAAQTGLTGIWSGTYTYSIQPSACGTTTFSSNGKVTLTILQTGASLSGRADLTDALIFSGNCNPAKGEITNVIFGSVDGSTVVWGFPRDPVVTQFSGTISGDSIAAQISDGAGGTGSLTITRTSSDATAIDVTGTWSGNYSFTDRCSNGATQSYNGAFTLALTQAADRAGGVVTIQNVPLYDQNCRTITLLNMVLSASGVVSGSTFAGGVYDPSGSFEFPISATIAGEAMNGTVAGANQTSTTGSFTLSRSSVQAPGSDFAGSYAGTYTETDNEAPFCINIGSLNYGGPISIAITQAGNAVSGSLILHDALDVRSDGFGDCVVVNVPDEILPLYGNVSGNTLSLLMPLGGGVSDLFKVTFAGDTITGTITDSFGDFASFSATRPATAPPGPRRRVVRP
jgi:hypothetical protein